METSGGAAAPTVGVAGGKRRKEDEVRVAEEYLSSLSDLNCNSKPLINMLTMLAEENIEFAPVIVNVVQEHINKVAVDFKLPILYLIDSIVKNVKSTYVALFSHCIVEIFSNVFEEVSEKVRERMYALRQTWNEVFSAQKLFALDMQIKRIDRNWPITAKAPHIHVNPDFLKTVNVQGAPAMPSEMEEILHAKTRELLELKKRKLELELEATKKHLEEQEKQLTKATESVMAPVESLAEGNSSLRPAERRAHVQGSGAAVVPRMLASGMVAPQQQQLYGVPPANIAIRPPQSGAFHHNFRNVRPQAHISSGIAMGVQQPGYVATNKTKVHPVNPALLNTVRHRDPRLARQQQQDQQQQQQQQLLPTRSGSNNAGSASKSNSGGGKSMSSSSPSYRGGKSSRSRTGSGSGSESKSSPTRSQYIGGGGGKSSSSSTRRTGKNSSSSSPAASSSRDKERKRSETKSLTSSPGGNSGGSKSSPALKCDKDTFDVAPLERKFTSPAGSPNKASSRERESSVGSSNSSKRSANHRSRSQHRSRSRSPNNPHSSQSEKRHRRHSESADRHDRELEKLKAAAAATSTAAAAAATVASKEFDKNENVKNAFKRDVAARTPTSSINDASSSSAAIGLMDVDLRRMGHAPSSVLARPVGPTPPPPTPPPPLLLLPPVPVSVLPADASMSMLMTHVYTKPCTSQFTANAGLVVTASTDSATTSKTTTSSPKVSFKIQKLFNKLEKSTEKSTTPSTMTSTTNSAFATAIALSTTTAETMGEPMAVDNCGAANDDSKRRASSKHVVHHQNAALEEDQPMAKKSKSAKIDVLFGSEDVDLRTMLVASPKTSAATANSRVMTPPPPSLVSDEKQQQQQQLNIENWDNIKVKESGNGANVSPKKTAGASSLDDVRAKLAKAAKYNRFGKFDKSHRELSQRFKLAELHMNEDSQEANDEKIRTIITQAQELLDTNSINQEQYRSLVQTVMSINETKKLDEAKRREAKAAANWVSQENNNDGDEDETTSLDAERMAARDAVLKKRIPRLVRAEHKNKGALGSGTATTPGSLSPLANADGSSHDSLKHEEKTDLNETAGAIKATKQGREKRLRPSKWTDRTDVVAPNAALPQRAWNGIGVSVGIGNRRGFRSSVPHPPMPPQAPNLRAPWHMNAGPSSLPQPFVATMPPMVAPTSTAAPRLPHTMSMAGVGVANTAGAAALPPKPCNSIDNPQADIVRTITIDGLSKDIRIYDDVAIVFMDLDQPREIGFQPGRRAIIIDNQEPIVLHFNDAYKTCPIDGQPHRLRFGFPSRELYIDDHWYEIYFGGPPVTIPVQCKLHILKAEGPPPQVNIGELRRDLVVGKINMIVDAYIIVPLFLDAKVQRFLLKDVEHTIQFADNLLTVLLNGEPTQVEYGGLPKSMMLRGEKFFIRFAALPQGVVAGKVRIKDMVYVKTEPPSESELELLQRERHDPGASISAASKVESTESAATTTTKREHVGEEVSAGEAPALGSLNIDELFQKLVSSGILGGGAKVPVASEAVPPPPATASASEDKNSPLPTPSTTTTTKTETSDDGTAANSGTTTTTTTTAVAATKSEKEAETAEQEGPPSEPICPIDLANAESVKVRQAAIVATLYTGMQCSSCGVRFPPEQTMKYSQHLDWHFRQNRRERDSTRKTHSRKWYYDLNDWVQYEEIEDFEEREKNFFEAQQGELDAADDSSQQQQQQQRASNSPLPSCAAGADDVDRACDMCHERFEQFYNEELEEWHLRAALRVEEKIYHPLCYEDYKASLNPPKKEEAVSDGDDRTRKEPVNADDDNAMDLIIKIEGDEKGDADDIEDDAGGAGKRSRATSAVTVVDDDDDVIVLPNEEPLVTEIDDDDEDDEYVPTSVSRAQMSAFGESARAASSSAPDGDVIESDVEIQEPHIPFTDLDTYEEKELASGGGGPEDGDESCSQLSFMNVKIKEEPKDENDADEDEDDGFEDVGTVMVLTADDEEISIQSSEGTQTQPTTAVSIPTGSPNGGERPASTTSLHPTTSGIGGEEVTADQIVVAQTPNTIAEQTMSMDGNQEPESEHNLSSVGPAPALPLASLVNKIRINITKNTSASNTNSLSTLLSTATAPPLSEQNRIPIVSTIPVLCSGGGGGAATSCNLNHLATLNGDGSESGGVVGGGGDNASFSTISVIGNYHQHQQQSQPTVAAGVATSTPPHTQLPLEETISYDLKPALQQVTLRKMKKVTSGIETSGLCAIM